MAPADSRELSGSICPACGQGTLRHRVGLVAILVILIMCLLAICVFASLRGDRPGQAIIWLWLLVTFFPLIVAFWHSGRHKCLQCGTKFTEANEIPAKHVCCPFCGSKAFRRRFLAGGSDFGGWFFFICSLLAVFYAAGEGKFELFSVGLACTVLSYWQFRSETLKCADCGKPFVLKYPLRLTQRCPNCGVSLRGATTAMLGELAVCPKCGTEWAIRVK